MTCTTRRITAFAWTVILCCLVAGAIASPSSAYAAEAEAGLANDANVLEAAACAEAPEAAAILQGADDMTAAESAITAEQDASQDDAQARDSIASDEQPDGLTPTPAVQELASEQTADPLADSGKAIADHEATEADMAAMTAQEETRPDATMKVNAHVQNKGWMGEKAVTESGTLIGTTGQALRLEALKITVSGPEGTVQCQAHVQDVGWQDIVTAGGTAGTSGRSLRVEAVRLALTDELSRWYDISYRAHVQNKGWMDWVADGGIAGTSGQALRLEALEIKLVPKASKADKAGDGIVGVRTSAHAQDVGWLNQVNSGEVAGTEGRGLRLESLKLVLDAGALGGGVELRTHVQDVGWQDYKANSAGTTGRGLRLEAVQIRLTGAIAEAYDIVYRAHVQNVGWQPWAVDGGIAGTEGRSLRMEAMQIKLVKKGSSQGVSDGTFFIAAASNVNTALSSSGGSGAQAATATYDANSTNERYYLRNENGGITLQSVATGMFLEADGANVVQKPYGISSDAQTWTLAWDGGYAIANKATGKAISLSGTKAVTGGSQQWTFADTNLIVGGNYLITNCAANKVLDVYGASWTSGANIVVHDSNGGGNQTFTIAHYGSDYYRITCTMTSKAVDVENGSTSDGANVRQYGVNNANAQRWKASINRSGKLVFTNQASGKALTAAGSGASGANVCSSANTGANTQQWTLAASSYQPDTVLQRAVSIAEGLSSDTPYLILVDLTNNRTVVFEGSCGNWSVIQNWTVSTGAPWSPTVLGDYEVDSRGYSFNGFDDGAAYTCYYWTQFWGDYLFHSVLYDQGTFDIQDGRLGYSISHGCVRMNIDHARWIYDEIPSGTHVKTYY